MSTQRHSNRPERRIFLYCYTLQMKLELTVRYFAKANGVAERCNRSILKRANAMQFDAGLPRSYWELAYICPTYLKNRSHSQDRDVTFW